MHTHIGGKVSTFEMQESDCLYAMDKYKIDKIISSNADSAEFDFRHNLLPEDKQISQYNSNARTINFAQDNRNKVYVALWVKPNTERVTKAFTDLIGRNIGVIKMIKVHPFYSSLRFDDKKLDEYIDLAHQFNLPILVHTAQDEYSSPALVYDVAKKHPNVKFIMGHMGLESDNNYAIELCSRLPNLYADTAWVSINSTINFINRCGSDRLFFGSDMPIDGKDTYAKNKSGERSLYQEYFFDLPHRVDFNDYENIMFNNAKRIFNL